MVTSKTHSRQGLLFVLEGIDGSGKSTVAERVVSFLQEKDIRTVLLSEPTNESVWGKEIRRRSPKGELSPEEELELFIKDRAWHIENRILPALGDGKVVLMDRYFFATAAYQSTSTGIHWSDILKRNRTEISAPEPDVVFVLDLPVEEALCRLDERKCERNQQFEQEDRLEKVRLAYLEMAENDPAGEYYLVDVTRPLEEVVASVTEKILTYL